VTPAERLAALKRLDRIIRERNTWTDLRALGAYEDLWEMAYGAAQLAVDVAAAARRVVEQDEPGEPAAQPDPVESLAIAEETFEAQAEALGEQPGVCNCESYEPCTGECCGPGNCSCSLPAEQPEDGTR
jgi:hypothetical protein